MTECNHALKSAATAFDKIVVLDWHDGPISGLAICRICEQIFRFDVLASDDDDRERIYALWSLPVSTHTVVSDLVAALGPPRWPIWVPAWSFPTEQIRRAIEERIDDAFSEGHGPEWILIAARLDACRAARNVQADDLQVKEMMKRVVTFADWETWIDVSRQGNG